jgi:3-hydroxybutyryl-CoA dehydrogenase
MRLAVVGAGIMGTGIAQVFAEAGAEVALYSRRRESLDRARARIEANLAEMRKLGVPVDPRALQRIRLTQDLAEAVAPADFVSENAPEDLALKQAVFRELDALASSSAVLTTNTSGLSISQIAAATSAPERVVGLHWLNPPHLMLPVEIVKGERTSEAAMAATCELARRAGRFPIRVERDVPGFLWNRLQLSLVREALHIVEQGIATAADVDLAVQWGLGLRWAAAGPFRVVDLAGLGTFHAIAGYLYPELSAASRPQPLLEEKLGRGEAGAAAGHGFYPYPPGAHEQLIRERDARLAAFRGILASEGGA